MKKRRGHLFLMTRWIWDCCVSYAGYVETCGAIRFFIIVQMYVRRYFQKVASKSYYIKNKFRSCYRMQHQIILL